MDTISYDFSCYLLQVGLKKALATSHRQQMYMLYTIGKGGWYDNGDN